MHKLLVEKVDEYDNFPLMVQLGFIHAIPEDDFDIASATIMDISFLGLFPKEIFQAMHKQHLYIGQLLYRKSSIFLLQNTKLR
jgi:hypothetical protein